ncbi:MAG: type II restriction endonuclease [Fimbriimonadales bacterium]
MLDIEYEIYLELERELIEGSVEAFLNADERQQGRYPTLQILITNLQRELITEMQPREKLVAISKPLALLYKLLTESFAQSRKTRAGSSAQYHVEFILNQLGFQGFYARQCTLNGTVDFLFPSYEMWLRDRRRCTVLSIKRTLRERYKQVFEELSATGGLTLYLMSTQPYSEAQKDITPEKVQRLNEQNVYLVVHDALKQARFPETASVIGFTQFFCRELSRLRLGWSDAT